ncbi:MAG: hypothetical protein IJQ34_10315 [Kiritimatiellae bacterium]|nr:hypothetical protein [Kiritimatiellia bacterium]
MKSKITTLTLTLCTIFFATSLSAISFEPIPVNGGGSNTNDESENTSVSASEAELVSVSPSVVYKKAITKSGFFGDGDVIYGTATLKCAKITKAGTVKVTLTLAPFFGKKGTATATFKPYSNGVIEGTLEFKNDTAVDIITGRDADGNFIFYGTGDYEVESAPTGTSSFKSGSYDLGVSLDEVEYLPDNYDIFEYSYPEAINGNFNGTKFDFGKTPTLKFAKVDGEFVLVGADDSEKPNINAMALKYAKKTSALSGSFKFLITNDGNVSEKTKPTIKSYKATIKGCVIGKTPSAAAQAKIKSKPADFSILFGSDDD